MPIESKDKIKGKKKRVKKGLHTTMIINVGEGNMLKNVVLLIILDNRKNKRK